MLIEIIEVIGYLQYNYANNANNSMIKNKKYLGKTCSKQNTFIEFTHTLKKFIYMGPLQYIYLMDCTINFNRYYEISVINCLVK